jgi:penicillin amidase
MKRALQWLGAGLLLLLVLLVGLALWYRQASLPVYGGTLHVDGLSAPLRIDRDAHAIPLIAGASEADALFGLGYAHAQDRLWQMDFKRRIAHGRLAELVGPAGLDTDRFLRTLGIGRSAQALLAAMDGETRALLDAYIAGVNAALATRGGPLPPEFLLLRAPPPAPWTALDSMALAMLMALDLSPEWREEITRLRLAARFSLAELNDLHPPPANDPVVATADYPQQYRLLGVFTAAAPGRSGVGDGAGRLAQPRSLSGFGAGIGSNAWAVAGERSASGRPLLANDPHLALTTPTIWYLARLDAPGLKVAGATLPGLPWVLIGRNEQVAWGTTAFHGDGADLYLERLHPTDPDQYQTPAGFAPFESHSETVRVRGADDVVVSVRRTRHGPVVSGLFGAFEPPLDAGRFVLALRWAAAEPGDRTLAALRAMNRARNAAEFRQALQGWTLTQQNFVFADRAGEIGWQVAGRFPLRATDNDFAGIAPAPGWQARYDWSGFVAPQELPGERNPARGFVVSANHNAVPAGYPHRLGHEFAPPWRAQRIEQRLLARDRHDAASMQAIQVDTVSLAARALLAAAAQAAPQTAAGRLAFERLQAWDGDMRVDAAEPLLLHAWKRKLRLAIFGDDLGDLAPLTVERSEMTQALINVLAGRARARDWCDRRDTARTETCAELAGEALDAAATELARDSGRDVLGLRWGDLHFARLEHRPLSNVAFLRTLFEHRVAVGGDTHSPAVAALAARGEAPFAAVHGAGTRLVFDLAHGLDRGATWILATGQSGHPASDHYSDQLELWQRGRTLPLHGRIGADGRLLLKPARQP